MEAVFRWPCFMEIVSQFFCSFATQVTQNIAQYVTMKLMGNPRTSIRYKYVKGGFGM